ncbi:hypothetical protein BCR43DRAFT_499048 [Syncephalastrum racemosum]|uniref:NET domain-containing protein n=1 Tax=Syncephalastrum racemosum TaxID=13706 RepID=A0A1X2H337_SYNRA|nr:hypothetical protein BCR43DRAFT_499048 [Syncephalastrum racemosum]
MGGVSVAHHESLYPPTRRKSLENFFDPGTASESSVEDLTGEVTDLMMRDSMNWLQPWTDETAVGLDDGSLSNQNVDASALPFDLEELFGSTENYLHAPLYDEMMFVQETTPVTTLETPVIETTAPSLPIPTKRRHSESSESSDSSSSSDEEDEEDDESVIPRTVANMSQRQYWSSSDESESESESEAPPTRVQRPGLLAQQHAATYALMHKRQMEEMLLSKITQELQADKLPGILSILSSERAGHQNDEVEIDLSRLPRDQLVVLLAYVDACIAEQQGGPAVELAHFIVQKEPQAAGGHPSSDASDSSEDESPKPAKRRRRKQPQAKKGPLSMAALSKQEEDEGDEDAEAARPPRRRKTSSSHHKKQPSSRRRKTPKEDPSVSMSVKGSHAPSVPRPKRRAALHKRRMLEEMVHGGAEDGEDEESQQDEGTLVVYSDEKMDLSVTDNTTIVHESASPSPPPAAIAAVMLESFTPSSEDSEDEEIDIML